MSITENDIVKIAKLARIAISGEEKQIFAKELSKILSLVDQLQEVDTSDTPRMTSVINGSLRTREDVTLQTPAPEEIVKNAPVSEYNCFVVPKVIE